MGIARIDLTELKSSARRAAERQWGQLGDLRSIASELEVRPLPQPAAPRVAIPTVGVVAADAGLVSVELRPFSLEFLHVADSEGRTHLAELFPLTTLAEDLVRILETTPVLARLAARLGIEWATVGRLWGETSAGSPGAFAEDTRLAAERLREVAEWAVAAELAETELARIDAGAGKAAAESPALLVLHDGFLSSFLLAERVLAERIPAYWLDLWSARGVTILGVGKTSVLWQRLALSLELDGRLAAGSEGYLVVSEELERRMTGRAGGERLGFGRVVFLKCRAHEVGEYLPVDVPPWLLDDRDSLDAALAALAAASETAFPRPGYPAPLGAAHEAARLGAFDAAVIRDRVVEALSEWVDPEEFELLRRSWAFPVASWPKVGRLGQGD